MIRMERFTNFFPSPVPAAILRIRGIRDDLMRHTGMCVRDVRAFLIISGKAIGCRYVFTLSKAWFYIDFILLVLYGNTTRNVI